METKKIEFNARVRRCQCAANAVTHFNLNRFDYGDVAFCFDFRAVLILTQLEYHHLNRNMCAVLWPARCIAKIVQYIWCVFFRFGSRLFWLNWVSDCMHLTNPKINVWNNSKWNPNECEQIARLIRRITKLAEADREWRARLESGVQSSSSEENNK